MGSRFDYQWQRAFAASGFVFAAITGAGLEGFWPQPPSFAWSAQRTAHFYAVHHSGFRVGITLCTIGMAFLLAWTIQYGYTLWTLNAASEVGGSRVVVAVTVVSLAASPILLSFDLAIFGIAAFRPTSTSPDVTRALSDVGWIGSELIWPMLCVGMALGGVLMLRTRRQRGGFPVWLGWYSLFAAALELGQIPNIMVQSGAFSGRGLFAWYLPTVSWGIWALAIGVSMWRNLSAQTGSPVQRDASRVTMPHHVSA